MASRRFAVVPLVLLLALAVAVLAGAGTGDAGPVATPGEPTQGTTPVGGVPDEPTDATVTTFVSGAGVCELAPAVDVTMHTNASGAVTLVVAGGLATDDAARFAPPAALTELEPGEYVLWTSTRADADRQPRPCADGGHVPYEATIQLPAGTEPLSLTVMHEGESVATWEPPSP
jgi:hypothetical protein